VPFQRLAAAPAAVARVAQITNRPISIPGEKKKLETQNKRNGNTSAALALQVLGRLTSRFISPVH
jgi:hypothetical protein